MRFLRRLPIILLTLGLVLAPLPRPPLQASDGESEKSGSPALTAILRSLLSPEPAGAEATEENVLPQNRPSEREEIPEERRENTKLFREPDGTYTAETYAAPVHVRAPDGTWKDIRTELVPTDSTGFAWRNRRGPFTVSFAASAKVADMVRIRSGDHEVTFGRPDGSVQVQGEQEQSTVTYEEVQSGVDLLYEVAPNALKELIVLTRPPDGPFALEFPIDASGLTAVEAPDGGIVLEDDHHDGVFLLPPPWMEDSATHPEDRPADPSDVSMEIVGGEGAFRLRVSADRGWLQDPERVYPVIIDPSVVQYTTVDTYVQSDDASDHSGENRLKVGAQGGGASKHRSLLKFTGIVNPLTGKNILSSELRLYEVDSFRCAARPVEVRRVNENWGSAVKWANQPARGMVLDSVNVAKGYSASCPDGWISLNVTAAVKNWVSGAWTNYGLEVEAQDETDNYGWKRFASAEAANVPYIQTSYNSYPGQPSGLSPATGSVVPDPTPVLSATYLDPDPGDLGYLEFEVYDGGALVASGLSPGTVSPGQAASWQVPGSSNLTPGRTYSWRVRGNDEIDVGSWSAGTRTFSINGPPVPPSDPLPPDGTVSTDTITPTLSALFSDPNGDSGRLEFEVYPQGGGNLVASGQSPVVASGSRGSWTVPGEALEAGVQYRWRVRGHDGMVWGPWTGDIGYTPNTLPQVPTDLSPPGGSWVSQTAPWLSARYLDPDPGDEGAVEFEVRRASDSELVASGTGSSAQPGELSTWQVPSGVLTSGVTYRWRARGNDGTGVSGWSDDAELRPNTAPQNPVALSPPSGTTAADATPTLEAAYEDPDGDPGRVRFEVSEEPAGVTVAAGEGTQTLSGGASEWTVPPGVLENGKTYSWRARATDGHAQSGWSDPAFYSRDLQAGPVAPPAAVGTFAGSGQNATMDGTGTGASFRDMGDVVSMGGYTYVATRGAIRKVDQSTGVVTTLAGSQSTGCTDSTNPAAVRFDWMDGMDTDDFFLYTVSSCGSGRSVRKTSLETGSTSTLASVPNALDVTVGPDGFLYVTTGPDRTIERIDPASGSRSTFVSLDRTVKSITSDEEHLWVATEGIDGNHRLERVHHATGVVAIAGEGPSTRLTALASQEGFIYAGSSDWGGDHNGIVRYSKTKGTWRIIAGTSGAGFADGVGTEAWFSHVTGVAAGGGGLWISDRGNFRLRKAISADPLPSAQQSSARHTLAISPGAVTTLAGGGQGATADGVGTEASFRQMGGVVSVGPFAYVSTLYAIRRVDRESGEVTTLAGSSSASASCVDAPSGTSARFRGRGDMATDGYYLYVVDECTTDRRIRRVSLQTGATSTVVRLPALSGVTFGPDHHLYATTGISGEILRIDPVSGRHTVFATLANQAHRLTSDGDALWALTTDGTISRIEQISIPGGTVSTLAARNGGFGSYGAIESAGGFLYVSMDQITQIGRYSKNDGSRVSVAGTNAAGHANGTGTDAWFDAISGIASDGESLFVASGGRMRKVTQGTTLNSDQSPTATSTLELEDPTVHTVAGDPLHREPWYLNSWSNGSFMEARFRHNADAVVVGTEVFVTNAAGIRRVDLATGQVSATGQSIGEYINESLCRDRSDGDEVRFSVLGSLTTDGRYLYALGECGWPPKQVRITRTDVDTGATSTVYAATESLDKPTAISFGPDGFLYMGSSDGTIDRLDRITGDTSHFAATAASIVDLTSDGQFLWGITQDSGNPTVWRIQRVSLADGTVSTLASTTEAIKAIESAGQHLYVSTGRMIRRYEKSDGSSVRVAGDPLSPPSWWDGGADEAVFGDVAAMASDGNMLWVADNGTSWVGETLRVVADEEVFAHGATSFGWEGYGGWWGGVNAPVGNFVTGVVDVEVPTAGPELKVERTYNSLDPAAGPFGRGWSFTYGMRWERAGVDGIAVIHPDGRREVFSKNGAEYKAPKGSYSELSAQGSGFLLTTKDRMEHRFDGEHRLVSITDTNGRRLHLDYQGTSRRLQEVTSEASGRSLSFDWTAGHITSVKTDSVTGHGRLEWTYEYDLQDRLLRACEPRLDPEGPQGTHYCTEYSYQGSLRIHRITTPRGVTEVELRYLPSGKVEWRADGAGNRTSFAYPGTKRVEVTDAQGHLTVQAYDGKFRLEKEILPPVPGEQDPVDVTYQYDAEGNQTRVTDPGGRTSRVEYDQRGNAVQVTDPGDNTTYAEYNAHDELVTLRDPRSSGPDDDTFATEYRYDSRGNLTRETKPPTQAFPNGTTKRWTYSDGSEPAIGGGTVPAGVVLSEEDPRGNETLYSYDSDGNLRRIIDPGGLRTEYAYDELGQKASETVFTDAVPAGVTTSFSYDEVGNLTRVTEPPVTNPVTGEVHRRRVLNEYDGDGNLVRATVRDLAGSDPDRVTSYGYDSVGRQIMVEDPEGGVLRRVYDELGGVIRVTDQEGRVIESEYDPRHRLTRVVATELSDPVTGASLPDVVLAAYTYDRAGRKLTERDPEGRVRRWSYLDNDLVKRVVLEDFHIRDGGTRNVVLEDYEYNAAGQMTREATAGGLRVLTHAYDRAGRRISSRLDPDGLNRLTNFAYDRAGNLIMERTSDGTRAEETRYTHDGGNRVTSKTVENGPGDLRTEYVYDDRGLLIAEIDPRGAAQGSQASDFTTSHSYDILGRLIETKLPPVMVEGPGQSPVTGRPTTSVGYDNFGNRTHEKDPRGEVTVSTYDALDRKTGVTHPSYTRPYDGAVLQPQETFFYDGVGNLTKKIDRRGGTWDFLFDDFNRVVRETEPLVSGELGRGTILHSYDRVGNKLSVVDQRGARTGWSYDDLNRPRRQTVFVRRAGQQDLELVTTFDHDDLGNKTFERNPEGEVTTWSYSPASEMVEMTDPLQEETHYEYDLASREIALTDPLGRKTRSDYDLAGRLVATRRLGPTGEELAVTGYRYDEAGNRTHLIPPRGFEAGNPDGFATRFTFDGANRLTAVTKPVSGSVDMVRSYGYDAAGNLTRMTLGDPSTPQGQARTTVMGYSPWNLVETTTEPATTAHPAQADRRWTITHDSGGLVDLEEQPGGVVMDRTHDQLGRLVQESGSGPGVASASRSFGYDLTGNRISFGHPSGGVSLAYDDRGLLVSSSGPAGEATFVYDGAGRLTQRTDAAGSASFTWTDRGELETATDPLTGIALHHSYDSSGQLRSITYGSGPTPPVRTFGYDDLGRITSDELKDPWGATSARSEYSYDPDGKLTSQDLDFPGISNPQEGNHAFEYDRAGRLTSWDPPTGSEVAYTWDQAGNRLSAGADTFTCDERNRLVSGPEGDYEYSPRGDLLEITGPSATTTFSFDALGRLTGRDGQVAFAYDSLDRIATRDMEAFSYSGTDLDPVAHGPWRYFRDPEGDLLSYSQGQQSALAGLNRHTDLTFGFSPAAEVSFTKAYEPFGDVAAATGTGAPPLGFQSDYTDPAWGGVWMGARWYEPGTASFLSRDTVQGDLESPVSLNRYTYAFADPLEYLDPDGRFSFSLSGFFSGIGSFFSSAFRGVTSALSAATTAIGRSVSSAASAVARWGTSVVKTVSSAATQIIPAIGTAVSRAASAVNSMVARAQRFVKKKVDAIGDIEIGGARLRDWGAELFSWETLKDASKGLVNFAAGFVDGLTGTLTLGLAGTKLGQPFKGPGLEISSRIGRGSGTGTGIVGMGVLFRGLTGLRTGPGFLRGAGSALDAPATSLISTSAVPLRIRAASATIGGTLTGAAEAFLNPNATAGSIARKALEGVGIGYILPGVGARGSSRVATTGQEHHAISRRIASALDDHPTLSGEYTPRDPRFVTRGADALSHRGYQTWHRQLDAEVVDWLARNPSATRTQFERFLFQRYSKPDLLERFPNGF